MRNGYSMIQSGFSVCGDWFVKEKIKKSVKMEVNVENADKKKLKLLMLNLIMKIIQMLLVVYLLQRKCKK
jgi:hypothetical protein